MSNTAEEALRATSFASRFSDKVLKKIFTNLKSKLLIASSNSMERWSSQKLADVKAYLENSESCAWTREDHYLATEYVIQRYLPADEARTQGQYDATMRDLKAKIDWNIDHPGAPNEEFKDDPGFAEQLKAILSTRVDRSEIVQMLSCIEREEDYGGQRQAIRMFKFWLDHPDNHIIDCDLLPAVKAAVNKFTSENN